MFKYQYIVTQPVFFLFVAFSCLLSAAFFWGRRRNKRIFLSTFNDLVDVVHPDDQTFTNIGGVVGYHANLITNKKSPFAKVDATITLLPRHSLLYMPISRMIMKFDRLFITLHMRARLPGEGHLIEKKYAGFRGPKITNEHILEKTEIQWGENRFFLYYEKVNIRDRLMAYVNRNPEPGMIRHIALVPGQRKCFLFMIPKTGAVKDAFAPVYRWIGSLTG
jgi:hypothetical protein